jgi:hypothetical protein
VAPLLQASRTVPIVFVTTADPSAPAPWIAWRAPVPQAVVASVPAVRSHRYMVINNRLLLVDPATGIVMAEVTD